MCPRSICTLSATTLQPCISTISRCAQKDIPSLKDVYANDFKIGTAVTTEELAPQSTKDLIAKHFNSITLGNELKPESILDKSATQASGSETDTVINLESARTILTY